MRTKADIIVVNWNGREDTLRLIDAVSPQLEATARLIIVDNASNDGSVAAFRAATPDATIVQLRENRGFTGGIAAGAEAATGEYLIFLNNDAIPERTWLSSLIGALEEAPPDVVAAGGKIVDMSGTRVDFIRGAMTFDGHAFQLGFRKLLEDVADSPAGTELFFACGGNMIVRRDYWERSGGFDGDYFAYLEDVDFGWRSWSSGHRIIYEPRALVRHRSSATSERLGNFERGVLFEKNAVQTMVKNVEEKHFAAALAPVFLAMLHRLHRYNVDRNDATLGLADAPLGERPQAGVRGSALGRVMRRFRADGDPLVRMQSRATEWFLRNSDRIMAKRALIQAGRRRSDEEIFARFPLLYVPTYHGDEELMSSALFRALRLNVASTDATLADIMQR